jgi:phage tail sheath protein FI
VSDAADRGITVTEIAAMDQPIDATPETTAAFVGRALRGPLNTAVLVKNFGEFRRHFGGTWSRSSLGPAVEQFFEHGGQRLYIVRVANNARGAMLCLPASGSALVLRALVPGSTEIVRASVDYDRIDESDEQLFNLTLQRMDPEKHLVADQEFYQAVSYREESEVFVGDALLSSALVRMETPLPTHRPEVTRAKSNSFDMAYVGHAQEGTDGSELSDYDLVGSKKHGTGLFALQTVEHFDLLYLPPPGKGVDTGPAALLAAERLCQKRHAMLIVDPPCNWTDVDSAVRGIRNLGFASPNMFGYFPRLRLRAESDSPARVAGGAIAGLLCKLDRHYGPWHDADQQGLGFKRKLAPAISLDAEDARILAREGLNSILSGPAGKARINGSVTLGRGSEVNHIFASLPVRRICNRIIASVDEVTRWAVFEKPDAQHSLRLAAQIRHYLAELFELGALANDRYVVQCDAHTILLGFHPVGSERPILLTLHQTARGCSVASTAFAPAELP